MHSTTKTGNIINLKEKTSINSLHYFIFRICFKKSVSVCRPVEISTKLLFYRTKFCWKCLQSQEFARFNCNLVHKFFAYIPDSRSIKHITPTLHSNIRTFERSKMTFYILILRIDRKTNLNYRFCFFAKKNVNIESKKFSIYSISVEQKSRWQTKRKKESSAMKIIPIIKK